MVLNSAVGYREAEPVIGIRLEVLAFGILDLNEACLT